MRKTLLFAFLSITFSSISQTVIFEEDFSAGIPATWAIVNEDGLVPDTSVSQFTAGWIAFTEDNSAASTSFYSPSGQASDYLISPQISLGLFSKLVWEAKSYDASYPDGYVVLISNTDSLIGSFTDTLFSITGEFSYWKKRSVQLDLEGYANEDVYIAIKNNTTDGYILQVDNFKVLGSDFAVLEDASMSENALSIYPNPCAEQLTVKGFRSGDTVEIYAADGQLVLTANAATINVGNLTPGAYFVRLINPAYTTTARFVKN